MNRPGFAAIAALILAAPLAHGAGFLTAPEFVTKASAAGQAEIELGKLAVQKASAAEVKAFAQKMIDDHTRVAAELAALASTKGLKVATPTDAQRAARANLSSKNGREFDNAYAEQMVKDHGEAVSLFSAAGTLDDPDLAAFARKTLPTLTDHQQLAARLSATH